MQNPRGRSRRQIGHFVFVKLIASSPATSLGSRWAPYMSLVTHCSYWPRISSTTRRFKQSPWNSTKATPSVAVHSCSKLRILLSFLTWHHCRGLCKTVMNCWDPARSEVKYASFWFRQCIELLTCFVQHGVGIAKKWESHACIVYTTNTSAIFSKIANAIAKFLRK